MSTQETKLRYHSSAIVMHWVIALSLLFMFVSGWYMVNADISKADQYRLFQIHKGAGVLVLLAVVFRLLVRFMTTPPSLPDLFSNKDKQLARYGHYALYVAMIILPLSGWVMVSSSPFGLPTIVFDLFEWPHIPGISRNKQVEDIANNIHWYAGLIFMLLIIVHIAAVIKHKKTDKINLLTRMWWTKNNE